MPLFNKKWFIMWFTSLNKRKLVKYGEVGQTEMGVADANLCKLCIWGQRSQVSPVQLNISVPLTDPTVAKSDSK